MKDSYLDYFQRLRVSESTSLKLLEGTNLRNDKGWINLNDLFKLPFSDEIQIETYLLETYGIDLNIKEHIDYLSQVLIKSIEFFENSLLRFCWKSFNRNINSKSDIIKFIKLANEIKSTSQINCCILKIANSINSILQNPRLQELDKKMEFLLRTKLLPFVYLQDENFLTTSNYTSWIHQHEFKEKKDKPVETETIPFKIMFRHKQYEKTLLKLLYNSNYTTALELKDLFWIRIEVEKEEQALFMLEFVFDLFFNPENQKIETDEDELFEYPLKQNFLTQLKNKNLLTIDLVEKNKHRISKDFYLFLKQNLKDNQKKSVSSWRYKDIKLTGWVFLPENIYEENSLLELYWLEIQIVLVNNKNETWFSHHSIFDAKKIISSMIRLQGYVSLNYIKKVIKETLMKNPDIKSSEERILQHFLETFLLKISFWNNSANFFTTKERYKTLILTDFYWKDVSFYDYKTNTWENKNK